MNQFKSRAYFLMWRCETIARTTSQQGNYDVVVGCETSRTNNAIRCFNDSSINNNKIKIDNNIDRDCSNNSGYKYCKNNLSFMMMIMIGLILLITSSFNNTSFVNGEVPLLLGSGSSLVEEFHKEAANYFIGYMKRSVDVMYDAFGSGTGVKNLFNSGGVYSFAATDYGLKAADRKINTDAKALPLMTTFISIISNIEGLKSQSITLSQEALVGIFNGSISMWNDQSLKILNPSLALPNASIYVVVRNDSSGTTDMLTTGLSLFSKEWASTYGNGTRITWSPLLSNRTIFAEDAKDVSFIITSTPNTIGYSTPTTFEQHLPATIKTRLGTSVTPSSTYLKTVITSGAISFNENFMHPSVVIDRPDIYPFIGVSYIVYLSSTMNDCVKAKYLAKLLEYYTSDRASKIIEDAAFSSLFIDTSLKGRYLENLKNFTCNGEPVLSSTGITQYSILLLSILLIIQLLCIL